MKIVDLQVIPFRVRRRSFYCGELMPEEEITQTLTKIVTDDGAEGYYLGGHGHGDQDGLHADEREVLEGRIKSLQPTRCDEISKSAGSWPRARGWSGCWRFRSDAAACS